MTLTGTLNSGGTVISNNLAPQVSLPTEADTLLTPAPVVGGVQPNVKYINLQLCAGLVPAEGRMGTWATVLLENPAGEQSLTEDQLLVQVSMSVKIIFSN